MLPGSSVPSRQIALCRIGVYTWFNHCSRDCGTIGTLTTVNEWKKLPASYTFWRCLVLGYHMAVIPALCLNVDQKQAAESLGCECDPPACLNPTELCKSCRCTSTTGSRPRFAADWGLPATGVLVVHSTACMASSSGCRHASPTFQLTQLHTASGTHFMCLMCVAGPHNPRLLFPHCVQVKEGNNTTNGNISTSPNKNKSQQPFHLN